MTALDRYPVRPDDFVACLALTNYAVLPGNEVRPGPLMFLLGPGPRQVTVVNPPRAATINLDTPAEDLPPLVYAVAPEDFTFVLVMLRAAATWPRLTGNGLLDVRPGDGP